MTEDDNHNHNDNKSNELYMMKAKLLTEQEQYLNGKANKKQSSNLDTDS